MDFSPKTEHLALAHGDTAPQHGPRPLPLFLHILWRETDGDPALRAHILRGLRKYQEATRPAPPPRPAAVAQAGSAQLQRYGMENGRFPVVFIPSIINPPQVLDLSEGRSMLRHMVAAGHDVHLVDWGSPAEQDAMLGLDGHVTGRLLPLMTSLDRPPILVGYCLGGTLALGLAAVMPIRAVATIAAPWHFDALASADRAAIASLWAGAKPLCEQLGYVPMEILQSGFWSIDAARTIRKFADFADMPDGSDEALAFLAVEDWANAGPPLSFAAGRDLFELFYAANACGRGEWMVDGKAVRVPSGDRPSLAICSSNDRIVPADSGPDLAAIRILPLGHVGMVVGRKAPDVLWNPLSEWLCSQGG